ncbi:MAG: sporulation protein YunB [Clostridia bacterium]|nr:sporulation protein YunB [Clostridia bacterium]
MRFDKSRLRLASLLMVFVVLIAITLECDRRLRVVINNYSLSKAKILSNSVINQTVYDYLEKKDISYTDIIKINTDSEGNVNSVEFDTVEITKIKSGIISLVQNNINKNETIKMSVSVGTLTGNQFLNNKGPTIDIDMKISSAVFSKISSSFISAGINQTLHRITLSVSTNVYFVMPWYRSSGDFQTEYVLAETIIVGRVPDAYTNVIEYPGSNIAGELFDYSAESHN